MRWRGCSATSSTSRSSVTVSASWSSRSTKVNPLPAKRRWAGAASSRRSTSCSTDATPPRPIGTTNFTRTFPPFRRRVSGRSTGQRSVPWTGSSRRPALSTASCRKTNLVIKNVMADPSHNLLSPAMIKVLFLSAPIVPHFSDPANMDFCRPVSIAAIKCTNWFKLSMFY